MSIVSKLINEIAGCVRNIQAKELACPDSQYYVYRLNNYIALFLLLLFVRVLVPETTVLALHSHEHTEEHLNDDAGYKIDKKHQHCHIDELFDAPFAPTPKIVITPLNLILTDNYSANHSYVWKFTFPNNTDLRGPPAV